jgi:hypothetical protein
LSSATGAVLDGIDGGSSASHPNVTAGSVTVNSANNGGAADDALWVNAATISAAATNGGVWINDAAATPVTIASVSAGGAVVIGSQGNLLLGSIDAGRNDVTLNSTTGAILDGISGGSSPKNPNVNGGSVALNAATTVGTFDDRVFVNADSIESTTPAAGQFINIPPTPYPGLPLLPGVSPVTEYAAYAHAQVQPPQQLPLTLIGQPLRMADPMDVSADLLGIALPAGVDSSASQQDSSMGTESKPIFGGNDDEVGRKKLSSRLKKKSLKQSKRNATSSTKGEG